MADENRIQELTDKRHDVGLSDDEADELGRLFAEQEGKPYSNAKLSNMPAGERGMDVPVGQTTDEPADEGLRDVPAERLKEEAEKEARPEETGR